MVLKRAILECSETGTELPCTLPGRYIYAIKIGNGLRKINKKRTRLPADAGKGAACEEGLHPA